MRVRGQVDFPTLLLSYSPALLLSYALGSRRVESAKYLETQMLIRLGALLLVLASLFGCAAVSDGGEQPVLGGSSPQEVVENFLEGLNNALKDPNIAQRETRRAWAEQLAGYFAPAERADQRVAMNEMLAGFADSASRPVVGSQVSLEISYNGIELISSSGDQALVRVVDGTLTLRWLDDKGELLRERSGGLTDLIGQRSGGLPVLRVGGSWFMTEG